MLLVADAEIATRGGIIIVVMVSKCLPYGSPQRTINNDFFLKKRHMIHQKKIKIRIF